MMGGSLYDKYFDENLVNDPKKLLDFTMNALRKQILIDIEPKSHKISLLKVKNILSLFLISLLFFFK